MMSAATLPKINIVDTQNLDASGIRNAVDSSSTLTDGGQSGRPKSSTSSEGNQQSNSKKSTVNIIRNGSSREATTSSPTSPPAQGTSPQAQGRPNTAIDPLSHHILKRTNTEKTIPPKLRNIASADTGNTELTSPVSQDGGTPGKQLIPEVIRSDSNLGKEKKKGVSFLSRFSIIGGKKKDHHDIDDDESELGDARTEGMNAHVFSSSIGANGYIPQHKEPPRYIKVRAHHKKVREFDRMFLAQELSGTKHAASDEKVPGLTTTTTEVPPSPSRPSKTPKTGGAVWATEFSKDGKYLAAAGRDQVVRIWGVISTADERHFHEHEEDITNSTSGGERLSAPVFRSKPIREFEGHTGEVLDLSWSKNNFLLSSSMDKTVRLWHISRQECLCTFKHKDFVTSIAFHPTDDRFFLAGSLDSVLRLWSIPDKNVAFWNQLPDLITAVAFSPCGKFAMAGVLSGLCLFYETEGLRYYTQIHVRSSRGKNAKGSKITGIRTINYPPNDHEGDIRVLITSNDSRVRMYNLRDKSLEMKLRGHENTCSQINASFSENSQYVICGSEDRKAYIWSTCPAESENKDKRPLEVFEAHADMVTAAIIAPATTRQLLSGSGDPIYDLCNPPPVTLRSREESTASSAFPAESEKRNSDAASESQFKKPEESPAYLARCSHTDGNIIITADYLGGIKVFRQDCAYQKRMQNNWETGSTFSKKILGRTNSVRTKNSSGSHSRRGSISQSSLSNTMPSDHILSWRNTVLDNSKHISPGSRNSPTDRSVSPAKLNRHSISTVNSQNNLASAARQQPYMGTPLHATSSVSTVSPPPSVHRPSAPNANQPPTPSFSFQAATDDNPWNVDAAGRSYQFWNPNTWAKSGGNNQDPNKLDVDGTARPVMLRNESVVSQLSSELESPDLGSELDEEEVIECRKCAGKKFKTKKGGLGRASKLLCVRCGTAAE